jgi:hypothetical protein
MTFHTTVEQYLNPRACVVNDHPSVLAHEMMTIEPGEKPTLMLTWKPTDFISRSHSDRFPPSYLCGRLGFVKVYVFPYQPC